jgi:hypothetical protein
VTTLGGHLRAVANRNSECEQFNALRKLLRVSRTCLRQLVADGMLRVRDPRITQASLASWCAKNCAVNPTAVFESTAVTNLRQDPCSWKRAARILNVEVADVQRFGFSRTTETRGHICDGQGIRRVLPEARDNHQHSPHLSPRQGNGWLASMAFLVLLKRSSCLVLKSTRLSYGHANVEGK